MEIIGILIGAAAVLCLVVSAIDCNRFVVRRYEIASPKLKRPCTMVLLSDLHNKSFGKENERLLARIDQIAPDAVLIAGDMLTAEKGKDFRNAQGLKLYPKQYGPMYETYFAGLEEGKVHPLVNESVMMPEYNICVCGSEITRCYYKRFKKHPMDEAYLEELLGKASDNAFQILIAHNPDYFEEYAAWGADLVVAGHVHGGIMRLPLLGGVLSPSMTLFPKYDGGLFRLGKAAMVLSRGLGTHTLPLRIFNPGELVVISLTPDK